MAEQEIKTVTFSVDVTEALLATMQGSDIARENVRNILYKRVDDFIAEALARTYSS